MASVVCMGELLIDFVAQQANVSLADAAGFTRAPGGAPANVAVALQRLGVPAAFVGKVGDDPFGDLLRRTLADEGVETAHLLVDPEARTTCVFVGVHDDGRKEMCFYRNPGADLMLRPEEVGAAMLAGAGAFHFGSIGLIAPPLADAQRRLTALAREQGLLLSYDPNYRPRLWPDEDLAREVIAGAFADAHLAKISEEEWEVATGTTDLDRGIDAVLDRGVELLLISRGADGAFATNGDWRLECPSPAVEVVETTGAGDSFLAAMIARLLPLREAAGSLRDVEREAIAEALRFATAAGALACTQPGAIPALPTNTEVEAFLGR